MLIEFDIPIRVIPKQSARFGRHVYPDPRVAKNAKELMGYVAQFRPDKPIEGPVYLALTFYKQYLKKHTDNLKQHTNPWCLSRPDWDNLSKQVCDVLQKSEFFVDDSQIACVVVQKFWGPEHMVKVGMGRLHGPKA